MGGRSKRDGIYVCLWLIHFVVQQELTQHCEAIILQKKKTSFYSIRLSILNDDYSVVQALWKVEPQLNQGLLRIHTEWVILARINLARKQSKKFFPPVECKRSSHQNYFINLWNRRRQQQALRRLKYSNCSANEFQKVISLI